MGRKVHRVRGNITVLPFSGGMWWVQLCCTNRRMCLQRGTPLSDHLLGSWEEAEDSRYVVGGSLLVQEMSWVRVIVISMPLISAKETLYSSDELSQFSWTSLLLSYENGECREPLEPSVVTSYSRGDSVNEIAALLICLPNQSVVCVRTEVWFYFYSSSALLA